MKKKKSSLKNDDAPDTYSNEINLILKNRMRIEFKKK